MTFSSINPYNGQVLKEYSGHTQQELDEILAHAKAAFELWRKVPIAERCKLIERVVEVINDNIDSYVNMITLEMGKPLSESHAEVTKCTTVCTYYAGHATKFLAPEIIESEASISFVRHDPIGAVLGIMPWNFPFWQAFRFAIPTLIAGNVAILKHASNVSGCLEMISSVFEKAGFPDGVFQHVIIDHKGIEGLIAHPVIKAVTLTGSEKAGSTVAALAGKYLKKSLLELGGNNAFIVWADADLNAAVDIAIKARMRNAGQSCIAAKRFIIVEEVYDEFLELFIAATKQLKVGDPMLSNTDIGPMARKDLADDLMKQVQKSIGLGAILLLGGTQDGCIFRPTVLGNVQPGMPVFDEETFGPVAAFIKATNIDHAFELSEQSKFGLGVTVFTNDVQKALDNAHRVSDGAYFINQLVRSDARLPFGGQKISGYGRELGLDGLMAFINRKTIFVK